MTWNPSTAAASSLPGGLAQAAQDDADCSQPHAKQARPSRITDTPGGKVSTKAIGDLVSLQTEKVFDNKDPELPYIGLEHLASGQPRLIGAARADESTSVNSVFRTDDILFAKLRPNLRKSVRAPFDGYCSTDILVLGCLPGMLHDLLTRGIDENGELRRRASSSKDRSPCAGKLPAGWQTSGVSDLADQDRQPVLTGPFGAELGQKDWSQEGVPVLRIGNVQAGYVDWTDVKYVRPEKARALARYCVREGDLLFARQGATTGRNALADHRSDGCLINYHIIRVAVDPNLCRPQVLHAIFNSDLVVRQIARDKGRGTREGISTGQILGLRFPLAPVHEQDRMLAVLEAVDLDLEHEMGFAAKLSLLRDGLSNDLLTGHVRVLPNFDQP
jgi:type I restriction enzyme S subunit